MSLEAVSMSQSPEEKFREYLLSRTTPQRFTDQQRELVRHIFAKHKHFDTEELIDDLKRAGKQISRATVYRTLDLLYDCGLVSRVRESSMLCTRCGSNAMPSFAIAAVACASWTGVKAV